ncbi:MAG: hypothetical protein M1352_01220 [Patescibacteria group bacterium]|nr:hypothetical protein [Patescibacteria group bacterium]
MSAFVVKLLDETVLPAVLVFCAKVTSLILAARFLGVSLTINRGALVFGNLYGLVLANNFSNIFLGLVVLSGAAIVLVRLYFFHSSHLRPAIQVKLLESNLDFIVSTSFDLFHQAAVWLALAFVVTLAFIVQAIFGLTSVFIAVTAILSLTALTVLVILDFEREVRIEKEETKALFTVEI